MVLNMVSTSCKLIASRLDSDFVIGFDYVIEMLQNSPHSEIGHEMENLKAITFMKRKQFDKAIECLKTLEKKNKEHCHSILTLKDCILEKTEPGVKNCLTSML